MSGARCTRHAMYNAGSTASSSTAYVATTLARLRDGPVSAGTDFPAGSGWPSASPAGISSTATCDATLPSLGGGEQCGRARVRQARCHASQVLDVQPGAVDAGAVALPVGVVEDHEPVLGQVRESGPQARLPGPTVHHDEVERAAELVGHRHVRSEVEVLVP